MVLIALFLIAFLFFDPAGNALRAREAMLLWAEAVAPSVFPFLALLPFLTSEYASALYAALPLNPFGRLLRLSKAALPSAVAGIFAGSPASALAIGDAVSSGRINLREAYTLFALTGGASPVFLVCSVGAGMFGNAAVGFKILLSAELSALITAFFAARLIKGGEAYAPAAGKRGNEVPGNMAGQVLNTLNIGAWMVLFRVYTGGLHERIACFAEISWGCQYASSIQSPLLAACIASFSGACICMQNISILGKAGLNGFFMFFIKCVQMLAGTAAFYGIDRFDAGAVFAAADAFTVSASLAPMLAGAIYLGKIIAKRKMEDGIQKTGH